MMKLKDRFQKRKITPLTVTENTLEKMMESTKKRKLGSIIMKANKDVKVGEETNLDKLFSVDEQTKYFKAYKDIVKDKTKLKINIAKGGMFETIADITQKRGKKINCFILLKRTDFSKKIVASQDIKKCEKVEVIVEIL